MEDTGNMVTDDIDLFAFSKSLAKLAAQVEREACAKLAELAEPYQTADLIRARGQA